MLWCWAGAFLIAPFAIGAISPQLDPDVSRASWPTFAGYVFLFWISGLFGMRSIHKRLQAKTMTSPFGCLGPMLVAIGLFLGFAKLFSETSVTPRSASERSHCRSNLKQIGIALHNFHDVYGHFPESAVGEPAVSWRVHALPFLDNPDLFETYDQTGLWDSEKNTDIATQGVSHLRCPSTETTTDNRGRWFTHYAMVAGQKTIGDRHGPRSIKDFSDGTSNTLAVVEAAGLNIVWTEPRDTQVSDQNLGINLTGRTSRKSPALISAWHRRGGNVLMADGSAHFLSHNMDPKVLKTLTTVDGDDSVEGWDDW
jgi:prepilin-type processing-associated H-X9-DG protein